jgi:excinuclease UvrABC nuclease subunit
MDVERRQVYGIFEKNTDEIIYVGKTRSSLEQRWFYHTWKENWSTSPIRKYMEARGFEKFEIKLLCICETEQDLDDWEKHFILELEPKYNVRLWSGW